NGEYLIRPHARTGERRHATDGGDALRLGLEHHQVERLLAMAARATHHQEGSGYTLELTGRDIGTRVVLHALDGALDLRWLHRHSHAKSPGAMTLHTVLREDLAHAQRPQHGYVALAGQIRGQARDSLLQLAHLCDHGDGEDEVDEHRQHDNDAESEKPRR